MSEKKRKAKMLMRILDSIHLTMGGTDEEKIAENSPAYLSNILEQDFLWK